MIIGDSSALIALAIIDKLELLDKIFGKVYVPKAVYEELCSNKKAQSQKLEIFLKDRVIDINLTLKYVGLGQGELEAIALYEEMNAKFLLIDDKRAKNFAKLNNINTIGSLGVLILAKELGFLKSIKSDINKLQKSKIYISPSLIKKVLKRVGED